MNFNHSIKIGEVGTPSASLHIQGVDDLVTGNSLLITNNSGDLVIKARNDKSLVMSNDAFIFSPDGQVLFGGSVSGTSGQLTLRNSSNTQIANLQVLSSNLLFDSGDTQFRNLSGTTQMFKEVSTGNLAIGTGFTSPGAKLHVKGDGNTSATYTAKFQNSSSYNTLLIRDDGNVGIGTTPVGALNVLANANSAYIASFIGAKANDHFYNGNNSFYYIQQLYSNVGAELDVYDGNLGRHFRLVNESNFMRIEKTSGVPLFITNGSSGSHKFAVFNSSSGGVGWLALGNQGTFTSTTAKFSALGDGTTSSTYTAIFQNNSQVDIFKIRDDRKIIYTDGNQASGRVLTSDASGIATWSAPAGTTTISGLTQYVIPMSNATGDNIVNGTWAYNGNDIYPLVSGSNIGNDTSPDFRIGTIYLSSTLNYIDHLVFSENGTERARFQNEKFGIGLAAPTAKLHVKGTGNTSSTKAFLATNSSNTGLMVIEDGGNVGVGITPTVKFQIDSTTSSDYLSVSNSGNYQAALGYTTAGGGGMVLKSAGGSSDIVRFNFNGNAYDYVNTGKNFGIGTASPASTLHVKGYATTDGVYITNASGNDQVYTGYISGTGGYFSALNNAGSTHIINFNNTNNGSVDYLNTGRNFGIGETTPTAKLHVKGSGSTSATYTAKFLNSSGTPSLVVRDDGSVYNLGGSSVSTNTAFGVGALLNATASSGRNSVFGAAGINLTDGADNSFFGYQAGYNVTTGQANTFLGNQAGIYNQTGSYNVIIGYAAGTGVGSFSGTTIIGAYAGNSNTGANNVFYGSGSGYNNTTGSDNTAIGGGALGSITTASGSVALGRFAGRFETSGNRLYIANDGYADLASGRTNSLVYGIFDANPANQIFTINGLLKISQGSPGTGKVLTSDTNGLATWAAPAGTTTISGLTQYVIPMSNAAGDNIVNGTWAYNGNDIYPLVSGSNIGNDTSPDFRIGTIYMASTLNYVSNLVFSENGTERGRFLTGGNFGVGTASPTYKITADSTASADAIALFNSGNLRSYLGYNATTGGQLTMFNTSNTLVVALNSTIGADYVNTGSNFAIGSTSAAYKLTVNNTISGDGIGVTKSGSLRSFLGYNSTSGGYWTLFDTSGSIIASMNSALGDYINTGSNFGIGDTSPNAKLSVKGSGNTSATFGLKIKNSSGTASLQVRDDGSVFNYGASSITSNTAFGLGALISNTTGSNNVANGTNSLTANLDGSFNTSSGWSSLAGNTSGSENTGIGYKALFANTSGGNNTAIGGQALQNNTTGEENAAIGVHSMLSNLTGNYNVAFGWNSLFSSTAAGQNVAIGAFSLQDNTADDNTAIGYASVQNNTTGTQNTGAGYRVLDTNTTGSKNSALGYQALFANSTGSNNTAIGHEAGRLVVGSANVFIGYQSGFYETGSNSLYIHNGLNVGTLAEGKTNSLIYGVFDASPANQVLTINGQIKITQGSPGAGKVLTSDANGLATWTTPGPTGPVKYSATFTPGTVNVANTITHSLSTTDIVVMMWDVTSGDAIQAKLDNRTSSTVDVTFAVNPAGNVRIVIMG